MESGLVLVFFVAILFTCGVEKISWRLQWVDRPSDRKIHEMPTPRLGGLGFVVIPMVFSLFTALHLPLFLIFALVSVFLGGFIDDISENNSVKGKLFFQLAACLIFALGISQAQVLVMGFGDLLGRFLIALFLLFLINAMNLMDNMNGLSAGIAITALTALTCLASGQAELRWLMLPLALEIACVAGFFLRNFPRAKIFMGDQGSQLLGFVLGASFILIVPSSFSSMSTAWLPLRTTIVAWLFFFPFVYDVSSVVAIRLKERRPLYVGDRCHWSHRLVRQGCSPVKAVLWIVAVQSLACGAVGVWIKLS